MKLLCGDCLELLPTLADRSVDLTVTSPPYDNLRTYNSSLDDWCEGKWRSVLSELYRVTKTGGVVVWVVGDATVKGSETGNSFRQALWAMECGFNLHDTMIYEKAQSFGGSKYAYIHCFEYMFVLAKGGVKTFNAIRDRRNVRGGNVESTAVGGITRNGEFRERKRIEYSEFGKRKNIWRYGVGGGKTGHPAVFPLKLAQDHVTSWSNPGDIVLDPFLGSGTTGVACVNTGRDFIGIERDPEYFKIASERIAASSMTTDTGDIFS